MEFALRWNGLQEHFSKWYFQFDLEALALSLACYAAHWLEDDPPVWLFIVGPPGSGKTVIIDAMKSLHGTQLMGDITASTFLSGFRSGSSGSLLRRYGNSFLMLWKDFTTILSKRAEAKMEIISQLREIYDGKFVKNTGIGHTVPWRGKATVIAAVTPVIDHQFLLLRDLGERFMYVRWHRRPGREMNRMAARHAGNEEEIKNRSQILINSMVDRQSLEVDSVESIDLTSYGIYDLAELVALLRSNVRHNENGKIIDVLEAEQGTRISKSLSQIVRAHAALFRRQITFQDIVIAQRTAMDSVPLVRRRIFESLPDETPYTAAELTRVTGSYHSSVKWALNDMEAMGIISVADSDGTKTFKLSRQFVELRKAAFPERRGQP